MQRVKMLGLARQYCGIGGFGFGQAALAVQAECLLDIANRRGHRSLARHEIQLISGGNAALDSTKSFSQASGKLSPFAASVNLSVCIRRDQAALHRDVAFRWLYKIYVGG
jgi:hypothetical protein